MPTTMKTNKVGGNGISENGRVILERSLNSLRRFAPFVIGPRTSHWQTALKDFLASEFPDCFRETSQGAAS